MNSDDQRRGMQRAIAVLTGTSQAFEADDLSSAEDFIRIILLEMTEEANGDPAILGSAFVEYSLALAVLVDALSELLVGEDLEQKLNLVRQFALVGEAVMD